MPHPFMRISKALRQNRFIQCSVMVHAITFLIASSSFMSYLDLKPVREKKSDEPVTGKAILDAKPGDNKPNN
jgi:hypothetical protein